MWTLDLIFPMQVNEENITMGIFTIHNSVYCNWRKNWDHFNEWFLLNWLKEYLSTGNPLLLHLTGAAAAATWVNIQHMNWKTNGNNFKWCHYHIFNFKSILNQFLFAVNPCIHWPQYNGFQYYDIRTKKQSCTYLKH